MNVPQVLAVGGGSVVPIPPLDAVAELAKVTVVDSANDHWPALPDAEVAFVWNFQWAAPGRLLTAAPGLRWIHVAAVGVDRVLSPEIVASDVLVTNSRGVFDRSIAEYVAGLLLAHTKEFRLTYDLQRQRVWRNRVTRTLAGQTVAVVGTGSIGRTIARMLKALEMRVVLVGTRRRLDPEFGEIRVAAELAAVARDCDALVLAAPATERNRGMVDRTVLDALGSDGYLVNIGRGSLVVEDDLVEALASGSLGGAALDVFATEPLPPESPLWRLPNVVVSPHMSADTEGFAQDLVAVFLRNLHRWIKGEPLDNVLDKKLGYVPSTA
ncbi:D-2-hydroxyacid dehydrogenase [Planosporangium flavigriseum]|uniref:2-hydroxyacid dehydrogenase n=1 Tax=Planosporangium flavigriseum TaxID=373681 RepID=A0A8J3M375_9ACTN|nr:D-2-hydroxyacid dehydrogenase [Planosporangium flavigriseum]NJC67728.1 D-2-hydroxyacid dehydrogenase [Planosporangium flavigriseum]GIG76005.1 2-hydroxyacid dehydrogenase [Planosporangium flavigriseum]